jgi:selenocysteine-specific elongation factor
MRGGLRVGDTLELPELRLQKKAKSMQMFRRAVQACGRGDRLGICVTQLDAKLVERGLACTPGGAGAWEGRAGLGRAGCRKQQNPKRATTPFPTQYL